MQMSKKPPTASKPAESKTVGATKPPAKSMKKNTSLPKNVRLDQPKDGGIFGEKASEPVNISLKRSAS